MNKITTIAVLPGKSGFEVFRSIVPLKKDSLAEIRKAMEALQKTGGEIRQNVRGSRAWGVWRMAENGKECFRCQSILKTQKEMREEEAERWQEIEERDAKKRKG